MRLFLFLLVLTLAVATDNEILAAFSILDENYLNYGLQPRVGRAMKSPENPLFGQTEMWEPRIDNGYANVLHDPNDPNGKWRLWYDVFTKCNNDERDDKGRYINCGGGKREVTPL